MLNARWSRPTWTNAQVRRRQYSWPSMVAGPKLAPHLRSSSTDGENGETPVAIMATKTTMLTPTIVGVTHSTGAGAIGLGCGEASDVGSASGPAGAATVVVASSEAGGAAPASGSSGRCGSFVMESLGSSLLEDDRLVPVHEHPVAEVEVHGPGQDDLLEVAALADEVVHRVAVAHPRDVLLDDRPLVEVGGDVVGSRPGHLHPARVGLVV